MNTTSYNKFLQSYNSGDLTISIDEYKAGDLLLSGFSKSKYKLLHNLLSWSALIVLFPISGFVFWQYSYWGVLSIVLGLLFFSFARRFSRKLVLKQLLLSEDFWDYALLHKCVTLLNNDGQTITSEFLVEREKKWQGAP